jgi:exodeoxyribonuclease V gamma subunit
MLTTYHSNRTEKLADRLAQILAQHHNAPLQPETVVVHNSGTARWLSLRLSSRLGICANFKFHLPAAFAWSIFQRVLKDVPARSPFAPPILTWRLIALLDSARSDPALSPLRAYLANGDQRQQYELAWRLAHTFDQYLVYRPDWIMRWEQHLESHWQAVLWQRLVANDNGPHWVKVQEAFLLAARAGKIERQALPARIAVFAVPGLSPSYLGFLAELARSVDIHLFLLNPCEEYWGDIVAERDLESPQANPYLAVGNPLLGSLGKQRRDFVDLVQELEAEEIELFENVPADSLLHCIQGDILQLRDGSACDRTTNELAPEDRSIQIHVCHSPMREAEVLFDQLLDLFASNPGLDPSDVVIMSPSIDTYAPYLEAVFASAHGNRRLPFSIAAQPGGTTTRIAETLLELTDVVHSRFEPNRVLDLLSVPVLRRRFALTEEDLALVRRWVRETGVRWGIDAQSRTALGLPDIKQHSWCAGLERLVLGYALPAREEQLFAGVLPYDGVEGSVAYVLGKFLSFTEQLFRLQRTLQAPRPIAEWVEALRDMLAELFQAREEEQAELQSVGEAIDSLATEAQQASFASPVTREVMQAALVRALEQRAGTPGLLTGAITCCSLASLRAIPFAVVCLIGMNNDAFPRTESTLSFDRMARDFRRGDRSSRNDDRALFLEALISSRWRLYVSYVGQDIRDNSVRPPSVLVSELVDYIERGFTVPRNLVVRHPLQAFSTRYFRGDDALFSYSSELCRAADQMVDGGSGPVPLIEAKLPEPDGSWRSVDLDQLAHFLCHPTRYLLRDRLGIQLEQREGLLASKEPFALDQQSRRRLRETLLAHALVKRPQAEVFSLVHGAGMLPHGAVGKAHFAKEYAYLERVAKKLRRALERERHQPVAVDFTVGELRLSGRLINVTADGILAVRLGEAQPQDWLRLWLQHLLLNQLRPSDVTPVSRLFTDDEEIVLSPVPNPEPHLNQLLELYWEGLTRPLHFFPRSAWQYVTHGESAARRVWEGSDFSRGERDEPYFQLAFRGHDPLDAEFASLASGVLRPVLACRQPS